MGKPVVPGDQERGCGERECATGDVGVHGHHHRVGLDASWHSSRQGTCELGEEGGVGGPK